MSLLNKANATTAPTSTPSTGGFEEMDDAQAVAVANAAAAAPAPAAAPAATPSPAPAPAAAPAAATAAPAVNLGSTATANVVNNAGTSTEVAVPSAGPGALALVGGRVKKKIVNYFEDRKNALTVDYNTLIQLFPSNGNIMDRESSKMLGEEIVFTFLSYQDSYVVSPEDDNAPDDVVRYSDDGVICSDGTPVQEHLDWLQANGFPKARLKNRNIVVGVVEESPKHSEYIGQLVQIDLPPSSKVMWDRYGIGALYATQTNRMTKEQADLIRMTVTVVRKQDNVYTQANFEAAHVKAKKA
jgi:hypothetical protein